MIRWTDAARSPKSRPTLSQSAAKEDAANWSKYSTMAPTEAMNSHVRNMNVRKYRISNKEFRMLKEDSHFEIRNSKFLVRYSIFVFFLRVNHSVSSNR